MVIKMTVETSSSRKSKKNFSWGWLDQAMSYKVVKNPQFWHTPQKLGKGTFWVRTSFSLVFHHAESENSKKSPKFGYECIFAWKQPYNDALIVFGYLDVRFAQHDFDWRASEASKVHSQRIVSRWFLQKIFWRTVDLIKIWQIVTI